jgi:hypothetical protein
VPAVKLAERPRSTHAKPQSAAAADPGERYCAAWVAPGLAT